MTHMTPKQCANLYAADHGFQADHLPEDYAEEAHRRWYDGPLNVHDYAHHACIDYCIARCEHFLSERLRRRQLEVEA